MKYLTIIFDLFKTFKFLVEFFETKAHQKQRIEEVKKIETLKKETEVIISKKINDKNDIDKLNEGLKF